MTRQKITRIANPFKPKPKGKKSNPGLLVTLSPATANPQKGNPMSKTKKAKGSHKNKQLAVAPKKKPNPLYAVPVKPKAKPKKNPDAVVLFGRSFRPVELAKIFFAGLAGVAVTKLVSARIGGELTDTPAGKVFISGAVAFGTGYAAAHLDPDFGAGMIFGGGMQTLSVALNGFLPEVGSRVSLNGIGDLTEINGYNAPFNTFTQTPAIPGVTYTQQLPAATPSAGNASIPVYEATFYN